MTHACPHKSSRSEEEINTTRLQKLGINTAELEGAGDPVDGQHVSGDAVVHLVHTREAHYFIEGIIHDVKEALVHFAFPPEEALAVLDPFEIADGYSPGVAENVRHGEDALGIDNRIGLPSGGAICALAENLRLHLIGILFGDLVFDGRGNGDLARLEENVGRGHLGSTAGEILERLLL